jgi:hypothetical protein
LNCILVCIMCALSKGQWWAMDIKRKLYYIAPITCHWYSPLYYNENKRIDFKMLQLSCWVELFVIRTTGSKCKCVLQLTIFLFYFFGNKCAFNKYWSAVKILSTLGIKMFFTRTSSNGHVQTDSIFSFEYTLDWWIMLSMWNCS